jgi:type IX secretion system PorP/SprF family membrane protein
LTPFISIIMTLFSTFCLAVISSLTFAQQEPQFTAFWNNYSLFNPGYTGVNNDIYGATSHRQQWVGIPGHPITSTANFDIKLDPIKGALGVGTMRDRYGALGSDRVYLTYATHIDLGIGTLGVGASAVYNRMRLDGNLLSPSSQGPPFILEEVLTQSKMNINLGAYYKTEVFEIGASVTQANEPLYDYISGKNARHYFFMTAYTFNLSEIIELKSSLYTKSVIHTPTVLDINNLVTFNKKYWSGVTFRGSRDEAIAFSVQAGATILDRYRVGYSFGTPLNDLAGATQGSHEFIAAIMISGQDD